MCSFLSVVILLEVSPLAVRAAEPPPPLNLSRGQVRASLADLAAQLRGDLKTLAEQGKEAYLDALFARVETDEARVLAVVARAVKSVGPRPLGNRILSLGLKVLADVLAVIPPSWQEAIVVSTLNKFISKTLREVRGCVARMPADSIKKGLEGLLKLVSDPRFADGQALTGDSWWEKFFGNTTIVRNFLIVVVTLASIGVAVGLAIAGASTAPIVAVVGALVALIALLNSAKLALE